MDKPTTRQTRSVKALNSTLARAYGKVREQTERLAAPLTPEDCVVQTMEDVSPTKWNLAHTTWFFETFILERFVPGYKRFHPDYPYLFNSYYNAVGPMHPRMERGCLSRPSLDEVKAYRQAVDAAMVDFLDQADVVGDDLADLVEIGLHHEQQHQELLLTDIKHVMWANPLKPAYQQEVVLETASSPGDLTWTTVEEDLHEVGHDGQGFCYDNEMPRHRVFVEAYALANRLTTNREFLEFMADGGYERPELWLSDGWATVQERGWRAPMYWVRSEEGWRQMTLHGMQAVALDEPVTHISSYEADAFARWAGFRLPREHEWEIVARDYIREGNLMDAGRFHPAGVGTGEAGHPRQLYGDAWEWTASPYTAYPGYKAPPGALGEYNGKFMCNQMVLRGGSCATPVDHIRSTYRNFFHPDKRWQFTGIRLAKDVS